MDKLIPSFSVENAISFFKKNIRSFKTESEDFSHILKSDDLEKFSLVKKIGEASLDGSGDLLVFTAKFNGDLSERTSKKIQFEIAKKILKNDFKDGAIFIFYDKTGNFRFSFIRINYGDKENKHTNWKRYTYFVDKEKTNKTFKDRIGNCTFSSLDEIQEAFSVEKLNKEFYQNIAKAFYSLIGGKIKINSKEEDYKLTLKLPSVSDTDKSVHQKFAVRLVGRTIFCWFLKNKVSANGLPLLPQGWLSSKVVVEVNNNQHNYYHAILEKLFFEVLNKRIENRPTNLPSGHENIPYLNGGLFEAVYDDFYEVDKNSGITKHLNTLIIPNKWFIDFFEVLERYNFTIDENTVNDSEVSIDPEMLGTIFENLLAEIDPDTEKSARKSTGSFYTPREIVEYMVEQSLIQYIKTKTQIEDEDKLKSLFVDDSEYTFTVKEADDILKAISEVKILDPACGSGAFPMGALHKIVKLLQKLDKGAVWWKAKQIENAAKVLDSKYLNDFKEKLENSNSDYARKLGVIQHSIYGVDIQPIAAEISKLRSFLSLIIDENIDDEAENRGIEPLPNLEFKFVTANTLIGLDEGVSKNTGSVSTGTLDFGETENLQNDLQQLRNSYLQANPKEKLKLRKDFENLQAKIFKQETKGSTPSKRAMQLSSWKPFSHDSSSWFDPEWMFGVDKFDMVIGNPPYRIVKSSNTDKIILNSYKNYETADFKINLYALFYEKSIKIGVNKGIVSLIIPDTSMNLNAFIKLRKFLLSTSKLDSITYYDENVFENATVGKSVIITSVIGEKPDEFNFYRYNTLDNYSIEKIDINIILSDKEHKFVITSGNSLENDLINKLKNIENNVNMYYNVFDGINPGSDFIKNEFITQQKKNKYSKKIIDGRDFERYSKINWGGNYIEYSETKVNEIKSQLKKIGKEYTARIIKKINFFEEEKILTRQTADCLIATIDFNKYYLKNSIHSTIIKKEYESVLSNYFILAIYNSILMNWYYKKISLEDGRVFPQVKIDRLRNLPIKIPSRKDLLRINDLVVKILDESDNQSLLKHQLEIDCIIFNIYNLSYDEILLVCPEFPLKEKEYKEQFLN